MNEAVLQQKLDSLNNFVPFPDATISQFGQILKNLDDWDMLRINPLLFAEKYDLDSATTVDLFIHAVKVGLFDFMWNMICSSCGGVEYSADSINEVLARGFFCTVCQRENPSDLDDRVEIAFSLNPTIKKLEIDPFSDALNYNRYFFSENLQFNSRQKQLFIDINHAVQALHPDQATTITTHLEAGRVYRLMSLILHQALNIHVSDTPAIEPQRVYVDILPTGLSPKEIFLSPGEVTFEVKNLRSRLTDVILQVIDKEKFHNLMVKNPPQFAPMLTAKMLLNNQSFRDLFRVQTLKPDLTLNIRSLTLLFTDLRGSTDLYDATGDVFAYNLIQEHFKILSEATRTHAGAIVKTMGDAIMATFSTPQDGVQAAIEMMAGLATLNDRLADEGHTLGLKVGLHEGNTLAVNADDRLDYFGQTVNIAARIQGLAQSGEIWLTDLIYQTNDTTEGLAAAGYQCEKQSVMLKGVSEPTTVYRYYR